MIFNVADIVAAFNFNTFFSNQSLHPPWRNIRPQRVSLLSHRDFDPRHLVDAKLSYIPESYAAHLEIQFWSSPKEKTTHGPWFSMAILMRKNSPNFHPNFLPKPKHHLSRIRVLAEERQLVVEDWFPPEQQSRFKYLISTVSWKLTDWYFFKKNMWSGVGGWVRGQGSVDCMFVGVGFVVLLLHPKTWWVGRSQWREWFGEMSLILLAEVQGRESLHWNG